MAGAEPFSNVAKPVVEQVVLDIATYNELLIGIKDASFERDNQAKKVDSLLNQIAEIRLEFEKIKNSEGKVSAVPASTNEDMTYSELAAITLAGATLAITLFGVAIATLAYIGYKQLLSVTIDTAASSAKDKTELILAEQIKNGQFDKSIADAIELISLRGIRAGSELDSNGETKENS